MTGIRPGRFSRCGVRFFAGASVVLGIGGGALARAKDSPPIAIESVSIIPMDTERIIADVTVLVDEGRVRAMGPAGFVSVPPDATRVDGRGQFLVPGLWDMHVHFEGPPVVLGKFLAAGVTGVRVMWGSATHVDYRQRVAAGELVGPELYVAGTIVEGEPPPELRDVIPTEGRALVSSHADGVRVVQRQAERGYDFIKVYNNVPTAAYEGVVAEATRLGLPVAGHVPFSVGLEGVLDAGQASIEHLRGYVWHLVPEDARRQPGADLRTRTLAWADGDPNRLRKLASRTRDAGVWNVPTLAVRMVMEPEPTLQAYLSSEAATRLSEERRTFYTERRRIPWLSNFTDEDFVTAAEGFAMGNALIRALVDVGGGVMAGTDTPPLGFALHRELEELVDAGLTPYQTLKTATRNPARFLARHDGTGMVTVGSPADLLLVEANPLEDISNIRRISGLVRQGRWYDRAQLDQLLRDAETP